MDELTPAQKAKDLGLKSLKQVSELSNTPLSTLHDWAKTRPKLFEVILLGCLKQTERPHSHVTR